MKQDPEKKKELKVALVGNPNSGKTTLFNALTHSHQSVGNWPGVTVERKEGKLRGSASFGRVVDLPGVYSLSPFSPEEIITRRELLEGRPDLIVNVVDGTNLERNLYLTTQLLELDCPVVVALNMMDEVRASGKLLDKKGLAADLGVPVVGVSAGRGEGLAELLEKIARHKGQNPKEREKKWGGTGALQTALEEIRRRIFPLCRERGYPAAFLAVKLFEGDSYAGKIPGFSRADREGVEAAIGRFPGLYGADRPMLIAEERYRWIGRMVGKRTLRAAGKNPQERTEKLDRVLTHRLFALPVFFLVMLSILLVTFGPPGRGLTELCKTYLLEPAAEGTGIVLVSLGVSEWCRSLVVEGILSGVGGVLVFLPQIALLFFFLTLLEGSGYMARVAFILDRAMGKIGLSGKAFVPLLLGFGCSIPAILATRTLDSEREKRLAILLTPFFSCSAKMPVYALFTAVFFPDQGVMVILFLYGLGILLGILTARFFKKIGIAGPSSAYLLELPPYRIPTGRNIGRQMWSRIRAFLVKVTTLILLVSVVIWFLQNFTPGLEKIDPGLELERSILAQIGLWMAPVFAPLGFGFWQAAISALSGFAAKETVVTTLRILYGGEGFVPALGAAFSRASALSYLVFILLYTPCVSAVSAARKELESRSWTGLLVVFQCLLAWLVSFVVYQIARWIG